MQLAPWRSPLARALHLNRSLVYARYVQLATVCRNGRPANRTIVFRGFLENTQQLQFVTDARSDKIDQIEGNPWAEVCWYFPKTREQFRLSGELCLVDPHHPDTALQTACRLMWAKLSDAARSQFAWATPGHARDPQDTFTPPIPDAEVPLDHFRLLLLDPLRVDHLELRGDPQNRQVYERVEETWCVLVVNP